MPPAADPIRTLAALAVGLLLVILLAGMVQAWIWAARRVRDGLPLLPEPEARAVPWGPGTVVLVLVSWVALNFGIANTYIILTGGMRKGPGMARSLTFTEQIVLVSAINSAALAIVPALIRATSGARLADLGLRSRGLRSQAGVGAMAFLLLTPVVYAFNILASLVWTPETHPLEKMVRTEFTPGIVPLALVSAVVLAPAAEELIFRGIIQGWLSRAFGAVEGKDRSSPDGPAPLETRADLGDLEEGPPPSPNAAPKAAIGPGLMAGRVGGPGCLKPIIVTSAFFALVHLPQWPAPIAIFFLSLGLGLVYQRSGSLVASFVMHALFNAVGTLLLIFTITLGVKGDKKLDPPAGDPRPVAAVATEMR